ncbi:helicase associated domain-containing protein [Streptomyces bobili]|uniref:helicase associated domain-containing protein n=1 Tax=Streptomyces bobili TaxID=67280 RepID=UPI0036F1035F
MRRRTGHGQGLARRHEELFAEGLEHARAHAARVGHLALPHTSGRAGAGFDLGRWLANRRADAASLTRRQAAQLSALDTWWNPPWPVDWQRAWHRARTHVREPGPVHGGDNLQGLPRWLERWLRHQITHYPQLHDGQQQAWFRSGVSVAARVRCLPTHAPSGSNTVRPVFCTQRTVRLRCETSVVHADL